LLPAQWVSLFYSISFDNLKSPHPNSINYQGKVVVLINEKTASFAEQQLLYLESVCANVCGGVTFVGSTTNGSVGKMTNIKLPGEVLIAVHSEIGGRGRVGGLIGDIRFLLA
jgi:hypothetical protein